MKSRLFSKSTFLFILFESDSLCLPFQSLCGMRIKGAEEEWVRREKDAVQEALKALRY